MIFEQKLNEQPVFWRKTGTTVRVSFGGNNANHDIISHIESNKSDE